MIDAKRLRKEYGTLTALKDIDFSVQQGQVLGLIGPNGAGKTTLLRILATLLRPSRGDVHIFDMDIDKDYLAIRRRIGYLPDFFNLYNDLTLAECLEFFARSYGVASEAIDEKINSVLIEVDLQDKRNDMIQHLSRGMVQRMGLAALLVRDPDIYLLDEPASGLDPNARIQLRETLKALSRQGKTVIISSHILTELSGFCSHISIMHKGKIARHGAVDDIRTELSGGKTVTISVLDRPEEAAELIRNSNLPVTVGDIHHKTIAIHVNGSEAEIAAVNKHLVQNDIDVCSLYEEKMDIEDLFKKISTE